MEGGRGRKRAGEGLYFPFTVPQTLLTVSKRFDSITVAVGVVICFCSRFVRSIWHAHHYCLSCFKVGDDIQQP